MHADTSAQARKKASRQALFAAREALGTSERDHANAAILNHLLGLMRTLDAKRVAGYVADEFEPGGTQLVRTLAQHSEALLLPVCQPKGMLLWGRYEGPDSLAPGRYGIPEPVGDLADSSVLEELDLIVVPALAANISGHRLGKGAGFYDRALNGCSTPTALLLFDHEGARDIPVEEHDAACDWTITPRQVYANK